MPLFKTHLTGTARPTLRRYGDAGRASAGFVPGVMVVALTGLVAIVSRGRPVWTSLGDAPVDRSEILGNVAVVGGAVFVGALIVAVVVHRTLLTRWSDAPSLSTSLQRVAPIAAVSLAALALLIIARTGLDRGAEGGLGDGVVPVGELPGEERPGGTITDTRMGLLAGEDRRPDGSEAGGAGQVPSALDPNLPTVLGVIAAAIVAAIGWVWYARRSARREHSSESDETGSLPDREALRGAVVTTIDSMLADPDPKTAIIGAYARLLEALAACDAPRRDYEGPLEHFQRALTTLRVRPAPVRHLIELFEVARFSTHALTTRHREQALEALRAAAEDLAAASQPPAGSASAQSIGAHR